MRMICVYPYKRFDPSDPKTKLAPIPPNIRKRRWISDVKLKEMDRIQQESGTNKILLPKNTEMVIGNVTMVNGSPRIPLCKTVTVTDEVKNYFDDKQCVPLTSASSQEYMKKWFDLGCPYIVADDLMHELKATKFAEIAALKSPSLPNYDSYVSKNAYEIPFTKSEFKKIKG